MDKSILNICQVSLARDIPIITENLKEFKKFYNEIRFFVICPKKEIDLFNKYLNFPEIELVDEDSIITLSNFNLIFEDLSFDVDYKEEFRSRLNWYYQQVLKISFVLNFIQNEKKDIVIWDADTVLLKKIKFFDGNKSFKYGTFFEFHKPYYITNQFILKKQPKYFISFLVQFIAITEREGTFILDELLKNFDNKDNLAKKISALVLGSIFNQHKNYNGSLFSEYELLGQINYLLKPVKQKSLLSLRYGLSGKLTKFQKVFCKILDFKHVTYEHSYQNKNSQGMLYRKQSWINLIRIFVKTLIKFYLRKIRHNLKYFYYYHIK